MVSVAALRESTDRYPLAREAAIAVAALGAFAIWVQLAGRLARVLLDAIDVPSVGFAYLNFALTATLTGSLMAAGMVGFAAVYLWVRSFERRAVELDRAVAVHAGLALAAGVIPIGLVKVVADVTGTSVSAITGTAVAAEVAILPSLLITALGLLVGLPFYLLATHLLVQRSIERAAGAVVAVAITVLIMTAFGPLDVPTADLPHSAVVTALVVAAIALPAVAATLFERRWLTALTAVPIAIVVCGIAAERITEVETLAGGLYALAELLVVAVGATAYQRTRSLLPSALAYVGFVVTADLVVYTLEAGVGI